MSTRGARLFFLWMAVALFVALGPHVASPQERALIEAYNSSGQRLFRQVAATPGNIVLSPYSIGTAMAMMLHGARGATEAEMAKVLELGLPRAAIAWESAKVLAILDSYDRSAAFSPAPSAKVLAANALILPTKGDAIGPDYIGDLKEHFEGRGVPRRRAR